MCVPDIRVGIQPAGLLLQPGQSSSTFPLESQQARVPQHSLHQLLGLAQAPGGFLPTWWGGGSLGPISTLLCSFPGLPTLIEPESPNWVPQESLPFNL